MQKVIYQCDQCSKVLADKSHISLRPGPDSGIAKPPNLKRGSAAWTIAPNIQGRFFHFCNGTCIGRFFAALFTNKKTNGKGN